MPDVMLNSKGQPITLNAREKKLAQYLEKKANALGYEVQVTTLTTVLKGITEQKFFEVAPADYIPVRVGEGAWSTNLVAFRSFALADDFSTGIINTGGNNARLANADAGLDSINVPVKNWAKTIGWTLFDLEFASKSGNWDIVVEKEKSRKRNWDLGIQKNAFLGVGNNTTGLANLSGITMNTTRITQSLSSMTADQLSTFLSGLIADYRTNAAFTAWPDTFVIPESDYVGLAAPSSSTYPIVSKLELLEKALKTITKQANFKILPLAYLDNVNSGFGWQQYILYNRSDESLRLDIPVDYTNTLANSIDNFSFQNVGYGQFTSVIPYRPAEVLYFKY